jgi:hypothetical protein
MNRTASECMMRDRWPTIPKREGWTFAEHATRKTLIEKKAHSGGLGNAALVSVPNGVPKKREKRI